MHDFPSFRLPLENESAPTHCADIDQMESDQDHIFRQLLNAQIEWLKTHVRWRCAARACFDSFEDAEPHLFELIRRIDEFNIRSRRMENGCGRAEARPKGLPVEIVLQKLSRTRTTPAQPRRTLRLPTSVPGRPLPVGAPQLTPEPLGIFSSPCRDLQTFTKVSPDKRAQRTSHHEHDRAFQALGSPRRRRLLVGGNPDKVPVERDSPVDRGRLISSDQAVRALSDAHDAVVAPHRIRLAIQKVD
jgi:hypothetical protein